MIILLKHTKILIFSPNEDEIKQIILNYIMISKICKLKYTNNNIKKNALSHVITLVYYKVLRIYFLHSKKQTKQFCSSNTCKCFMKNGMDAKNPPT